MNSPEEHIRWLEHIRNCGHPMLVFSPFGSGWGRSPMNPNAWKTPEGSPIWTPRTVPRESRAAQDRQNKALLENQDHHDTRAVHWVNDDAGYEEWVSAHPDGFIGNVHNPPSGKYFMIHRASHKLPDRSNPDTENPRTGNIYSKVTALEFSELIAWARRNLPDLEGINGSNYCKTCGPLDEAPVESAPTTNFRDYVLRADQMLSRGRIKRPEGVLKPKVSTGTTSLYYRDPKVRAWILQRAADHCERCGIPSPFLTENEGPYLESHHIVMLSEGGPDTPENTAALCPNCHRNLHYGIERDRLRDQLLKSIASKEAAFKKIPKR
jgi:hypothetical protein